MFLGLIKTRWLDCLRRSSIWTLDQVIIDTTLQNQFGTFSANAEPLVPIGDAVMQETFEVLCLDMHRIIVEILVFTNLYVCIPQVLVGNREWMRRNGINVPDVVDRIMIDQEEQGQTVVLCAINGKTIIV